MPVPDKQLDLRQRQRQAVAREITDIAYVLFMQRGFRETTIEDIALAAAMSKRTVLRHFASKEEIVLGKVDIVGREMLADFANRPIGEPMWEALTHAFDGIVARVDGPGKQWVSEPIQRMVFGTPALLARYLEKMQYVQDAVVDILRERAEQAGHPVAADDPAPRVLTIAAFGCLFAAHQSWLAAGASGSFREALDRAIGSLESR